MNQETKQKEETPKEKKKKNWILFQEVIWTQPNKGCVTL